MNIEKNIGESSLKEAGFDHKYRIDHPVAVTTNNNKVKILSSFTIHKNELRIGDIIVFEIFSNVINNSDGMVSPIIFIEDTKPYLFNPSVPNGKSKLSHTVMVKDKNTLEFPRSSEATNISKKLTPSINLNTDISKEIKINIGCKSYKKAIGSTFILEEFICTIIRP